jgi:DnaJ-class molecular chaperone
MNKNKNYYSILGVNFESTHREIKKAYYKLSYEYHPDKNKETDISMFNEITESYNVLCNEESKNEYDLKSKFGKNYNEYFELFDINVDFSYEDGKDKFEKFKKFEIYNIQIEIDENFDGSLEYERWVKCKKCDGSGKDLSSKIVIKDSSGKVVKTFDADDGCDFCEGSGKDYRGNPCSFCSGNGKVGLNQCSKCSGEKRILGKQKLSGIKIEGEETKIDSMGHFSKDGVVGYLLLIKR